MERKLGMVVHTVSPSTNRNDRNTINIKSYELASACYHWRIPAFYTNTLKESAEGCVGGFGGNQKGDM